MQRYEYAVIEIAPSPISGVPGGGSYFFQEKLNEMAAKGWRLKQVVATVVSGHTREILVIIERGSPGGSVG